MPYAVASPAISFDFSQYFLGSGSVGSAPVIITVTDPSANLDPTKYDTVTVHVKSTTDSTGITLTLNETGVNTGVFKNSNLIFMKSNYLFTVGNTVTITVTDFAANMSSTAIDLLPVTIRSNSDTTGFSTSYDETGVNTGVFTGKLTLTSGMTSTNSIKVKGGDIVSITDTFGGRTTNALVVPNPDPTIGALKAEIGDTITASYGMQTATASIGNDEVIPGGGGGGLIRPGLVLDFLSAIVGVVGGSPYVVSPPSFGGGYYHFSDGLTLNSSKKETFDISQYNNEVPRQILVSGEKVNMTFKIFESYNPQAIIHMGLYIIPRGQDMLTSNSLASIVWDKNSLLAINDPNNILFDANASSTSDGKFQYIKFEFVPTKSYNKMSFLARAWNDHKYSTDVRLYDAVSEMSIISPKTLPNGIVRYDNFKDLQTTLEKDRFYKPNILNHIHSTNDVFGSTESGHVYWLYDTMNHTVTLIIEDKTGNELSSFKRNLEPYAVEKKDDYSFMHFTVQQLNRWNKEQLQEAMQLEAVKAMSTALKKGIIPLSNW